MTSVCGQCACFCVGSPGSGGQKGLSGMRNGLEREPPVRKAAGINRPNQYKKELYV